MKKCLVVDDVEVTRFTVKQIVSDLGLDLVMAVTGDEALAALRHDQIDVVLLDWYLRKKSGLELLAQIRAEFGARLPVILFSGVESSNKRDEALRAGANAFLEKPTTKEKLEVCFKELGIV